MNVAQLARRLWTEDDGVLSFEWCMLVTMLTAGVVGGLAAARDAMIDELGDVAEAMLALDDTYVLSQPLAAHCRYGRRRHAVHAAGGGHCRGQRVH